MTRYSVTESIVIDAPIDRVWNTIRNFHDFSWAANMVKTCEAVGDISGPAPGAKRIANGVFHETLRELDEDRYLLRYSVEEGPSPLASNEISDFQGVMQLQDMTADDNTRVEWSATWDAQNDAGVRFCKGMYRGLLQELANHCSLV